MDRTTQLACIAVFVFGASSTSEDDLRASWNGAVVSGTVKGTPIPQCSSCVAAFDRAFDPRVSSRGVHRLTKPSDRVCVSDTDVVNCAE
jgi:hypothetical protein